MGQAGPVLTTRSSVDSDHTTTVKSGLNCLFVLQEQAEHEDENLADLSDSHCTATTGTMKEGDSFANERPEL
eukprot:5155949-Amphidinium_carterae.2